MNELDLATPFAAIRANWNAYCDQLQDSVGYQGCTDDCYDDCYDEDEDGCEACGEYECDCAQQDAGWSRGRHTEHHRSSRW